MGYDNGFWMVFTGFWMGFTGIFAFKPACRPFHCTVNKPKRNIARSNLLWRQWVMTKIIDFQWKLPFLMKNAIFDDFGQKSQKSTPIRAKHEKTRKITRSKWIRKSRFFTFPGGTPGNFEFLVKKSLFHHFLMIFWCFSSKIDQNLDFEGPSPLGSFEGCHNPISTPSGSLFGVKMIKNH